MHKLRYRQGAVFRALNETPGGMAPVVLRTGYTKFLPWLGIIDIEKARTLPGARPIKLAMVYYSNGPDIGSEWVKLPAHKSIKGCWVPGGVYALIEDGTFTILIRKKDPDGYH
ncbi:hypothetical protein [Marinobacter sp. V034]|uniref:hypothetical protein n=1 Tax=Marinobacter sp. V034 TaxID=3459610 RepID=UPI004044054D